MSCNMKNYIVLCALALILMLCGCKQKNQSEIINLHEPLTIKKGLHSSDIDNNNGDKCPRCSSRNIGRWVFGLAPSEDSLLEEEIKNGHVHLGGCIVEEDAPRYHCNDCNYNWGNWRMQNNLN